MVLMSDPRDPGSLSENGNGTQITMRFVSVIGPPALIICQYDWIPRVKGSLRVLGEVRIVGILRWPDKKEH